MNFKLFANTQGIDISKIKVDQKVPLCKIYIKAK